MMEEDLENSELICRFCRLGGTNENPLFHPCICTGSIKWIHQDCLVQWMKYSGKEACVVCRHKFTFANIYAPDMPENIPYTDIILGLLCNIKTVFRGVFQYVLVFISWLCVVPLVVSRVFQSLFNGSANAIINFPAFVISPDHVAEDICKGIVVVVCTLLSFIALVWLREQIVQDGGPDWLERDEVEDRREGRRRRAVIQNNGRRHHRHAVRNAIQERQQVAPPNAAVNLERREDNNWLADWDRAADELTWDRLLGLDGSFVFLEHMFWVMALSSVFMTVFAFFPYYLGWYVLYLMDFKSLIDAMHVDGIGLLIGLLGYFIVTIMLLILYTVFSLSQLRKISRIVGMCYLSMKVLLLLVIECGILPLGCGVWIDICSLSFFSGTLKDRYADFNDSPGTSMFVHWLVGMVFIYYFAALIILLREVLRPGLLWFLRNLNDPDFSPIQEMIHLKMYRHVRRFMVSVIIFGTVIGCVFWVPSVMIRWLFPNFVPFVATPHTESMNEITMELLVLQVMITLMMPAMLEQTLVKYFVGSLLKVWCEVVSWMLDLKSYMLGDVPRAANPNPVDEEAANPQFQGLAAEHQAFLHRGGPLAVTFQPYKRPQWFPARITLLLMISAISLVILSMFVICTPLYVGRRIVGAVDARFSLIDKRGVGDGEEGEVGAPHDIYSVSTGVYFSWLVARVLLDIYHVVCRGRILWHIFRWTGLILKCVALSIWVIAIIPFMFGLLMDLIIMIPLRVELDQTPVVWFLQDWSLGVMYMKIFGAIVLIGPNWSFKHNLELAIAQGIIRMHFGFIMKKLVMPMVMALALALTIPYVASYGIIPLIISDFELRNYVGRRMYPGIVLGMFSIIFVEYQVHNLYDLYIRIRDEKYLVGRKLKNYSRRHQQGKKNNNREREEVVQQVN